ncbi:MAG: hypothetical protein AB1847_17745 [bacterium]
MKRTLRYLAILSFFLVVILLGLFKIVNFDVGWHLKAGEYICSHRSIPRQDMFSYIAQGNKWVDSHWLFQVLLYLSYTLGGAGGGIVLRILVIGLTFGLLFLTIYRKEYYHVSVVICLAALFMAFQRFLLRPEIFTFLFLALFVYGAENFSKHPRLSLIVIPVAQALWVNMHGLHVLGIAFLGLYLLGDLVQTLLNRHIPFVPAIEARPGEWRQKGLLSGLTLFALLINANGFDGILYPYKIFGELKTKPMIFSMLTELVSPLSIKQAPFPDPCVIYKIFLPLSALALVLQIKRLRLAHLLPCGAFFYLSLLAIRNVPLFAIVATPMTIRNIHGILDFCQKKKFFPATWPVSPVAGVPLIALSLWTCVFIADNGLYHRLHYLRTFGFGISDSYPKEAVDYLKGRNLAGNIFNSSDIGGYLLWQMYPPKQVALDGRWEVYGDFLDNLKRLNDPRYFAELTAKYRIEAIILYKRSMEISLMAPWLQISPFWQPARETDTAIVYERVD